MQKIKVVSDGDRTDARYQLPPSLEEEYLEILEDLEEEKPVIHQLKKFMAEHPGYPQAGNLLSAVYLAVGKPELAWHTNEKLLERFPDYPGAVLFKVKILLEMENYDDLEFFVDLNLEFGEQFTGRHIVSISELAEYESLVIGWQLANSQTDEAVRRARGMIELIRQFFTEVPFEERVITAFESYLPPEEQTLEVKALLGDLVRLRMGVPVRPVFHHPQINLLYGDLEPGDVDKVLALLQLPRKTLLADLRAAIRDGIIHFPFFREYYEEDMCGLLILSFLLLAELKEPGDLEEWLHCLQQEETLIEWWIGDWMLQLMFVVGWQLGQGDLPRMESAMKENFLYDWATPGLAVSLGQIALCHAEKEPAVMEIFYRVLESILNTGDYSSELSPFLVDTILEIAFPLDNERFRPLVEAAYNKGYVDQEFYGDIEKFFHEADTREALLDGFEYRTTQQGLKTWLTRYLNGDLTILVDPS